MHGKIAYITTSFGSLSHTFIRREVLELRRLELSISLFGIRPETAKELSHDEQILIKETIYLYPLKIFGIIQSNITFILNSPFRYFKTLLFALLNEEIHPFRHLKLVYHFFVSPYLALNMQKKRIAHIHAHFLNVSATMAMYCSKLLDISFSATVHSAGSKGLKAMTALKSKLRDAKFICAVSEYNKEYISREIYPCSNKTYIIRCGIEPDDYNWKKNQRPIEGPIKLLSIGRFVEKKGFKYLIEAGNLLKKENIGFELVMIGDGALKNNLKNLRRNYSLDKEVIFKGELPHREVKKMLNNSDILVVPSVEDSTGGKEGIPVVIMEAMASGAFVIATKHSGIPEIVKNKITGILVPEKNSSAITEAIKSVIRNNNLAKSCADNARRLVSEQYDIKKSAQIKKRIFEENI